MFHVTSHELRRVNVSAEILSKWSLIPEGGVLIYSGAVTYDTLLTVDPILVVSREKAGGSALPSTKDPWETGPPDAVGMESLSEGERVDDDASWGI